MQHANMIDHDEYAEHYHKRIHCRSGHVAVEYRGHMLVWAGFMENQEGRQSEYLSAAELIVYNSSTEVWSHIITTGDIPQKNSGSCGLILENCLYVYGGFQETLDPWQYESNINHLYCLNLRTMTWKRLTPTGVSPMACDKLAGWTYKGKLYFFGGFGPAPENPLDAPFTHIPSTEDVHVRGWNNQLVCYDPDTNEWTWPHTKGPTPCPRAAHAADIIGHKAYIFGGRLRSIRMATLHCLNMELMEWSPNLTNPGENVPEGRSWHSFTFINDTTAVLYGGFSQQSMILSDCWRLELPNHTWHLVDKKSIAEPRLWHKGIYLTSIKTLILVGGHSTSVFAPPHKRLRGGGWLDDCWKLHVEDEVVDWEHVELAYDHGHPRFWHASVCGGPGELLVHGGHVQPFYQLEFYIQEHANSLLKLNFEPKSLLRLCLTAAVDNYKETVSEWSTLPVMLQNILTARLDQM